MKLTKVNLKGLTRNETGLMVIFLLLIAVHTISVINQSLADLKADSVAKVSYVPVIAAIQVKLQLKDEQSFSHLFDIMPRVVVEDNAAAVDDVEPTLNEMDAKLIAVAIVGDSLKVKISYNLDGETIYKNIQLNDILFDYTLAEISLNRVTFTSEKGDLNLQMFKLQEQVES